MNPDIKRAAAASARIDTISHLPRASAPRSTQEELGCVVRGLEERREARDRVGSSQAYGRG